jgi:hypothetical protein
MKPETEHQGAETREKGGARHRFETILHPPRVSDHFRHPSFLWKGGGSAQARQSISIYPMETRN